MNFKTIQDLFDLPESLQRTRRAIMAEIAALRMSIQDSARLRAELAPKPFVVVFIEALKKEPPQHRPQLPYDSGFSSVCDGALDLPVRKIERITMAQSGFVDKTLRLSFQPDVVIAKLRFIIFCDIYRVRVDALKCANINLSATSEACPIAYYDGEVSPADRIEIFCSER